MFQFHPAIFTYAYVELIEVVARVKRKKVY